MESGLAGSHKDVYDRVFRHPMPHNLPWRDVVSMLGAIDDVSAVEDERGHVRVTRNGMTLHMHRPRGKDLSGKKELMQVRHFLERSVIPAAPPAAKAGTHLLVVIDHREARIFSTELHGSVPQRITPYDPFGFGRSLHYNQDDSNGQRKPEQKAFYEAVAKTLGGAQQILLFGTGTGASSAMEQLLAALKRDHKELLLRVVGMSVVDEHHMSEDQLLAKARELFAAS